MLFISTPLSKSGLIILSIGLFERDLSPIKVAFIPLLANNPQSNRIEVPELPQSSSFEGLENVSPFISLTLFRPFFIDMPQSFRQYSVD